MTRLTPAAPSHAGQRPGHHFIEIRFNGFDLQFMAQQAQAADQMIDVRHRLGHAAQSVLPERGIVKMHRQVLQHQIEGRGRVLQVMDEKGRHGLEGLQFLGLQKLLRKLGVEQSRPPPGRRRI